MAKLRDVYTTVRASTVLRTAGDVQATLMIEGSAALAALKKLHEAKMLTTVAANGTVGYEVPEDAKTDERMNELAKAAGIDLDEELEQYKGAHLD